LFGLNRYRQECLNGVDEFDEFVQGSPSFKAGESCASCARGLSSSVAHHLQGVCKRVLVLDKSWGSIRSTILLWVVY